MSVRLCHCDASVRLNLNSTHENCFTTCPVEGKFQQQTEEVLDSCTSPHAMQGDPGDKTFGMFTVHEEMLENPVNC